MGILWRLLAPKSLKRARRTVRRAAHPVRTVGWAISPRPVKQIRRGAFKVAHPLEAAEFAAENAVVGAVRDKRRRKRSKPAPRAAPGRAPARSDQPQQVRVAWLPGTTEIPITGLRYYPKAVRDCLRGMPDGGQAEVDVVLLPEPENEHDANAIGVYTRAGQVGHVPRRVAAVLQPALIALSAAHEGLPAGSPARAEMRGGEPRIVLMIDLSELGIDPTALG
jgi:HIRAN domain